MSVLVDPVQGAHLDSLNLIDILCTSPETQVIMDCTERDGGKDGIGVRIAVVDTQSNVVTRKIPVGRAPNGIAVDPTGRRVYVVNEMSNDVSVIDSATEAVVASVEVGEDPFVIGQFIAPAARAPQTLGSPMSGDGCCLAPAEHAGAGACVLVLLPVLMLSVVGLRTRLVPLRAQ